MSGGFLRKISMAAGLCAGLAAPLAPSVLRAQEGANSAAFWLQEERRQEQHYRPNAGSRQQQRVRRLVPNAKLARPTIWHGPERHELPPPPLGDQHAPAEPQHQQPQSPQPPATADAQQPAPPAAEPQRADAPPQSVGAPTPVARISIAVVGDNLGYWLGQGMLEAQADPAAAGRLGVVRKTKDSSGLVRDDYYDWQKNFRDVLNGPEKYDAIAVMIGSNDRQELRDSAGRHEPLSPRWREIYAARVDAFLTLAKEKDTPVFWVGMPIMRAERYSSEIGQLNEIYRARVEAAGGKFVDVWDAFADENGKFSVFGPDVNGQIVKLRTSDGVHFTRAGARKLAYFLEQGMRGMFERQQPQPAPLAPVAPLAAPPQPGAGPQAALPAAPPAGAPTPVAPAAPPPPPPKPLAGPILPLTAPALSPGGELAGGENPQLARANAQRDQLAGSAPSQPGRADDFAWPRR
jgi:hypothetical protein